MSLSIDCPPGSKRKVKVREKIRTTWEKSDPLENMKRVLREHIFLSSSSVFGSFILIFLLFSLHPNLMILLMMRKEAAHPLIPLLHPSYSSDTNCSIRSISFLFFPHSVSFSLNPFSLSSRCFCFFELISRFSSVCFVCYLSVLCVVHSVPRLLLSSTLK